MAVQRNLVSNSTMPFLEVFDQIKFGKRNLDYITHVTHPTINISKTHVSA
jgi:hypothetical protein